MKMITWTMVSSAIYTKRDFNRKKPGSWQNWDEKKVLTLIRIPKMIWLNGHETNAKQTSVYIKNELLAVLSTSSNYIN